MKTRNLALIVLLSISNVLFASTLSKLSVDDATINQLVLMASVRGISIEGTEDELRKSISESLKLEEDDLSSSSTIDDVEIGKPIESNPYIIEIISAQTLLKTGSDNPLIILEGSAQITFKVKANDEPQKLSASKIVVDLRNKRLSALGDVSFESTIDSANKSFHNINGEIVSLNWATNAIDVAGGIISTTRK